MDRFHKLLFASLALALLLSACSPAPSASLSPELTMPPANTDGGLPPREGDDPIDIWRENRLFRDTEVVLPPNAVNYPVLIAEHLELDWDALKSYAAMQVPDGVKWNEHTGMSATMNTSTRKGRPHWYSIQSDAYETQFGQEITVLAEGILDARYSFYKRFEQPPSIEDDDLLYSEQEAVEILRSALFEWGMPAGELELQFAVQYDRTRGLMSDHPQYYYIQDAAILDDDRVGYLVRFKHMLYDIPVFDQHYWITNDPANPETEDQYIFSGHATHGVVTNLGLHSVQLHFRRVIEVEQYDVPICPISDVIDRHLQMIRMEAGIVGRIELMLVPTYYGGEDEDIRVRLVPAWCFFDPKGVNRLIIDASTAKTIKPSEKHWEYILSNP